MISVPLSALLMIFSIKVSADDPSLVPPSWHSALAATVTLFTNGFAV
jgi:hypothetical protein